ncbi:serine hydrolase domain-containing protein [Ascidiimonas aurantiaca]|uniref:serine hydrolase domain-containing protein n=1 Tax=Ascidiimonas aurantiaca TaxID=1685432 RepID=UPI0030ECC65F
MFKKAHRIAKRIVRQRKVPGMAISVSYQGDMVWQAGLGFADLNTRTPVHPAKTVFRIASVSKPLAATALAKMVEEGLVKLDASVYDYLPEYPPKPYDFTLRQLGGHLAGIRSYRGNEFFSNQPLSIREGVALFENDSLLFEPGTSYQYNTYDWVLLSLIIQKVANIPFEEYVYTKVLEPLGMRSTFFKEDRTQIPEMAVFYSRKGIRRFKEAPPVNNFFKLAGGGFLSTSEDICRLGNAYLTEGFLSKSTAAQFLTSQKIQDKLTYYGIGWEVSYDHRNRPYRGHTGSGVGGYAIFRIYPEQQIVFSMLTNMSNPRMDKKIRRLLDAVINAIDPEKK